jgi:hypothetical protein
MILFTSTPELFGAEIRAIGSVNFGRGGIERWVDYWDSRHYGVAGIASKRTPADQFPQDFGESTVSGAYGTRPEEGGDRPVHGVRRRRRRRRPLHRRRLLRGPRTAHQHRRPDRHHGVLRRALSSHLPYSGNGVTVRHTVRSAHGGGYDWTAPGAGVSQAAVALELDVHQRISRLTTVWDGSLVMADVLGRCSISPSKSDSPRVTAEGKRDTRTSTLVFGGLTYP